MHGAPRKREDARCAEIAELQEELANLRAEIGAPRKREKSLRRAEDATYFRAYLRPVRPSRLRPAQTRRTRVKSAETIRYFRYSPLRGAITTPSCAQGHSKSH